MRKFVNGILVDLTEEEIAKVLHKQWMARPLYIRKWIETIKWLKEQIDNIKLAINGGI